MTNTTNTTNVTNNETTAIDLKAIRRAEKFLVDNYPTGVVTLFCNEIRAKGAQEKWDHAARWEAVAKWVSDQDLIYPLEEGVPMALTEWYEKLYLPSKRTNSSYNKNYKGKGQQNKESDDFDRVTGDSPFA